MPTMRSALLVITPVGSGVPDPSIFSRVLICKDKDENERGMIKEEQTIGRKVQRVCPRLFFRVLRRQAQLQFPARTKPFQEGHLLFQALIPIGLNCGSANMLRQVVYQTSEYGMG